MKTLTAIEALKSAITLTEDLKKLEAAGDVGRFRLVFEHHDKGIEERVNALIDRRTSSRSLTGFFIAEAEKELEQAKAQVATSLGLPPIANAPTGNVAPLRAAE